MIQPWPQADEKKIDAPAERDFARLQDFIVAIRNFRAEHNIPPQEKVAVNYSGRRSRLINDHGAVIQTLARVSTLTKSNLTDITGSLGGLDFTIAYQQDTEHQQKEIQKISHYIQILERKLQNQNFIKKAPAEVVNKERQKLAEQKERLRKLMG